jgi:hypothetical protein
MYSTVSRYSFTVRNARSKKPPCQNSPASRRPWLSEVAQSFDLLKLCGSSSEKAADFEQHEVCASLLSSLGKWSVGKAGQ